jgi:hypothetical protein
MPMSVHMLGLRVRMEAIQRSKNGHAPHTTTGVARMSCASACADSETLGNSRCPAIARIIVAIDSGRVHQKRRRKSTSSGFSPSSTLGISGSSAMPHFGQTPGPC